MRYGHARIVTHEDFPANSRRYERSGRIFSQIGKELGIDYILVGAVRWKKTGEQAGVRITPELIRASDDRRLWADNYEREMMGVFAVQEEIAAKIVSAPGRLHP